MCEEIPDPVCGKSTVTGKLKSFGNQCEFDGANECKEDGSPFEFVKKGECDVGGDCPGVCTLQFDPVCGKSADGKLKTFGNQCQFNAANRCKEEGSPFTFVKKGACESSCSSCKTIKCSAGFRCVERGGCGKCEPFVDSSPLPTCCAAILCPVNTKCEINDKGVCGCVKMPEPLPSCCAFTLCLEGTQCVADAAGKCKCKPLAQPL